MTSLRKEDYVDLPKGYKFLWEFIGHKGKHFTGFIKGNKLEEYVKKGLKNGNDFSKTKVPFYVTATNLNTFAIEVFGTGTIADKVRASTAIPMMFEPKKLNGQYYIDGAVVKEKLPKVLVDLDPELDVVIVSNFSYEPRPNVFDNEYLEHSNLPMLEIVRRVFEMHERPNWPKKIGKTKIICLKPGVNISVDLFKPDKYVAHNVYQQSKAYMSYHIEKKLQRMGYTVTRKRGNNGNKSNS